MVKVGVPRALLYYQYYPMWETFFEELGAETVVSPPTNKDVFTDGNACAVAETCLPVKIFFGHAISLADRCDYLFIPAIRSMGRKAYNCSKFLGLPDMTRAIVPACPPILDPEIDLNKGRHDLHQAIYDVGRHFTSNRAKIKKASEDAWKANITYRNKMSDEKITPVQALGNTLKENLAPASLNPDQALRIAVIGHPYVTYDDYINHRLVDRVQAMGALVFTPEMAPQKDLDIAMMKLIGKPHWSFEVDIIGSGEYYLQEGVDGIISLAVFGCGPDSMMINIVRHRARQMQVPLLHLSLDEHASEGGLLTRLEAFIDMVRRRKRVCV